MTKVWLMIWDYFPGQEGGSERQARLIAKNLGHLGLTCEVITAWSHFSMKFTERDGKTLIKRFGYFSPLRVLIQDFIKLILRYLSFSIIRRKLLSDTKYDKISSSCQFWLQLPWTLISRFSFILHLLIYICLKKPQVDIIHLHEPSWLGGVAWFLSKLTGSAVICQEATSPALPKLGYDVPFRRLIDKFRILPDYIAMAQYTKDDLILKGVSEDRIYILPNGVNIPKQKSKSGANNILYVGNLSQGSGWKGFDVLFEAWLYIFRKNSKARLTVVGGGDIAPWLTFLKKYGCEQSVTFTGRISDPDRYYRTACIFVLPSRVEGMSNALLEAQSWGIPAVVSDIPGNKAVIKHGVNGLVVPVGSSHALAEKVLELMEDDARREELSRNARNIAEKNFDIKVVSKQLLLIYQSCLKKRTNLV